MTILSIEIFGGNTGQLGPEASMLTIVLRSCPPRVLCMLECKTILISKPVVAALEEKAVGVLVAQVDAESDEDDADDGSQDAHHNDGSLTNKKSVNFC